MTDIPRILSAQKYLTLVDAPEGLDALAIADMARASSKAEKGGLVIHVARDDARAALLRDAISFFAAEIEVLAFPAWDCLPYDRVSPKSEVVANRMATLSRLVHRGEGDQTPLIVITTLNAAMQRVPPGPEVGEASFTVRSGNQLDLDALQAFLTRNGYSRASTVMEPGDFAVRGGIVDIFPPGSDVPYRLDMFGDTLESVRTFNPETQRSIAQKDRISLVPVSEIFLDTESIQRFRQSYVAAFGGGTGDDPLYESISAGRKHPGMEHWLPLFHEALETLFDYTKGKGALWTFDPLSEDARAARLEQIIDYHQARVDVPQIPSGREFAAPVYKPLAPHTLYVMDKEWSQHLADVQVRVFSPFSEPASDKVLSLGGHAGRNFAPERSQDGVNVFDAVAKHIDELKKQGKRVAVACWTEGSLDRMQSVLNEHGVEATHLAKDWDDWQAQPKSTLSLLVLGLETGFQTEDLAVICEQDILGDRLIRRHGRSKRAQNFLKEASSLSLGDLVVHVEHGIGRFDGLQTIDVNEAPHDCLLLIYDGGDKLYLPVENIELLSRYGSDDTLTQLDRLGGSGWQARKAKLKERIRDIANQLIKIAAERELRQAEKIVPQQGMYEEFCARFPFEETEDQEAAIEDVIDDLARGRPMDRLICGDVGFGKTEVALRAAFVAAMSGQQVAIVCPTTLLCRQHFKTFSERFAGWPIRVEQLSRLVSTSEATQIKKDMTAGLVDIVVGTHALLGKSISFKRLGLLIIDEEQHFGVTHKERLKSLRTDVHVLTLTATPIPRTLQMALSGVRELSLIATPPVDRLAIRTFITPFDPVVIREALLREHYRGGQSFYVCPRVADLPEAEAFLKEYVPEIKSVTAHGQMPTAQLEDTMNAFYEGKYDVLLSTTIVESGLDIPTANTLVVHRADMFGLSQLYQIRGRIGRSKLRAYSYFTLPTKRKITETAEKRLKVLQAMDTLGAGFNIASHDLDIRGAGNLLGEEQSGHVKEVGIELYQNMLEEAVASLRSGDQTVSLDDQWSPQINLGTSVLIPEHFISDLNVRMAIYRRVAELETREEIDSFAAELIDRFGPLPEDVEHLLKIVSIKYLCRTCNVGKVDAGPKGCLISFRNESFPNPEGLIDYISVQTARVKLRPDYRLVVTQTWDLPEERLDGVERVMKQLAAIALDTEQVA